MDTCDVVKDTRGDVHTLCVSIYPKQQQQQQQNHHRQQQQQQQPQEAATRVVQALKEQLQQHLYAAHPHNQQQQAPWHSCHQGSNSSGHMPLGTVPESSSVHCGSSGSGSSGAHAANGVPHGMPAGACADTLVQVQHTYSHSARSPAPWSPQQQQQQQQEQQQQELDQSYCLQLMTVERCSRLWFHLQRAWVGAHMRAALAAAGAPGELREMSSSPRQPSAAQLTSSNTVGPRCREGCVCVCVCVAERC